MCRSAAAAPGGPYWRAISRDVLWVGSEPKHMPVGVPDLHLTGPRKVLRRLENRGTSLAVLEIEGLDVFNAEPDPSPRVSLIAFGQVDAGAVAAHAREVVATPFRRWRSRGRRRSTARYVQGWRHSRSDWRARTVFAPLSFRAWQTPRTQVSGVSTPTRDSRTACSTERPRPAAMLHRKPTAQPDISASSRRTCLQLLCPIGLAQIAVECAERQMTGLSGDFE